jgi:DNA-binding PadR family transcriptional regulator
MVKKKDYASLIESLGMELRRGSLVLAVLTQLRAEQYGYSLKQRLAEAGLEINEGTLYPLLRRLESQELLQSEWRVENEARPRRYYQISDLGNRVLDELSQEWKSISSAVNGLLNNGD